MDHVLTVCLDWLDPRGLVATATTNWHFRRLAKQLTEKRVRDVDFNALRGLFGPESWTVPFGSQLNYLQSLLALLETPEAWGKARTEADGGNRRNAVKAWVTKLKKARKLTFPQRAFAAADPVAARLVPRDCSSGKIWHLAAVGYLCRWYTGTNRAQGHGHFAERLQNAARSAGRRCS